MTQEINKELIDFNEAMREVEVTLQQYEHSPFTEQAYASLKGKISTYVSQLVAESIRISKRHKADLVSQTHIENASDNLIAKKRSKLNYLAGTMGGILLGATFCNIFGMMVLNQVYSTTGVIVTILIGIIGAFLIAINLSNE